MKSRILIYCFLMPGTILLSQSNLIPNPGFEEYISCPQYLSDFDNVLKNWSATNTGTPNYFNACSNSPDVGVPNHFFGIKKAYRGNGFVGIMTGNSFREYISVQLTKPLKANTNYKLSFYSSIIQRTNCNSMGLDVVFTKEKSIPKNTSGNLDAAPSITFTTNYQDDTWLHNQACYRAIGGEQHLVIGDFHYPIALHNCKDGEISYYYLDEVSLIENDVSTFSEINKTYCNTPYPIKVNALEITGITTDTTLIEWEWDGIKTNKFKSIEKDGQYKIKASLSDCVIKEYLVTIANNDCNASLFVPNVFTPNDDGINDEWKINFKGYTILNASIYSRNGQLVFSSINEHKNWDGTFNGKTLPSGVYVYHIKYLNTSTNVVSYKKGDITIIK